MLNCRAYMWRCIRAPHPSNALAPALAPALRRDAALSLRQSQQRLFSVETRLRRRELTEVDQLTRFGGDPWERSAQAANQRWTAEHTLKNQPTARDQRLREGQVWYGRRDPNVTPEDWYKRIKELRHLTDPLEVAAFVRKELDKGRVSEMLQLVRMASHSMQCIVSWNHLIDYQLSRGRTSRAIKIYNEMKKRAQFPDAHTYTIVLRGLALNAHESGAVAKAITIYHSMSNPNAKVAQSIIHTNAALKVCARALDMDALWSIAAKMPQSGAGAANMITYTTILNAIRQNLLVNIPPGESIDEVAARRDRGIVEGRRIWEDIMGKWRNADIIVEEELVCSMGRLLLIGIRPRDWDDVLSLVEQTMDLPRLVPRLGTKAHLQAGLDRIRSPDTPEEYRFDDDHLSPSKAPMRGDEFLPLVPHGTMSNTLTYAIPFNNTLSLVQEACQKLVAKKAARGYWDLLTDPTTYNVIPDINNVNMRLRVLRQDRASAEVAQLLKEHFTDKGVSPPLATFRIAMSACVRDKNNHNSLRHGGQILQLMTDTRPDADPRVVTMFAELAIAFPSAKGEDLIDALALLDPIINNLRIQIGVGAEDTTSKEPCARHLTADERGEAFAALRKIYGVIDRLVRSDLIAEERKAPLKEERARLSAFFQRAVFKKNTVKRLASINPFRRKGNPIAPDFEMYEESEKEV